jgi:hypothetical protein
MMHRKLAVWAGALCLALVPATAEAGGKKKPPPPPKDHCKKQKKCPKKVTGRMTGHGHLTTGQYGRVQWEFRNSVCGADRFPDLKVAWGGGNRFILQAYSTPLVCLDTDSDEGNPRAGFDTIVGQGTGTLNGAPASAQFRFTDNGEPGRNDTATIDIFDAGGNNVLHLVNVTASGGGNHQAHRLTGRDARGR